MRPVMADTGMRRGSKNPEGSPGGAFWPPRAKRPQRGRSLLQDGVATRAAPPLVGSYFAGLATGVTLTANASVYVAWIWSPTAISLNCSGSRAFRSTVRSGPFTVMV